MPVLRTAIHPLICPYTLSRTPPPHRGSDAAVLVPSPPVHPDRGPGVHLHRLCHRNRHDVPGLQASLQQPALQDGARRHHPGPSAAHQCIHQAPPPAAHGPSHCTCASVMWGSARDCHAQTSTDTRPFVVCTSLMWGSARDDISCGDRRVMISHNHLPVFAFGINERVPSPATCRHPCALAAIVCCPVLHRCGRRSTRASGTSCLGWPLEPSSRGCRLQRCVTRVLCKV